MILVSYLLGIILADWGLGFSSTLIILSAIVVAGILLMGRSTPAGATRTVAIRLGAGIAAAYSAIDLGDLIDGLGSWPADDILLTAAAVIGAGILLVAAWRLTNGNVISDSTALLPATGRALPERLVGLGSAAVIVGWVILRASGAAFRTEASLAVLAAVLTLAVLWLARGGAGQVSLPIPAGLLLAGLGVLAGILAVAWLVGILIRRGGRTGGHRVAVTAREP